MVNMRWDERVCEWGLTASNPYINGHGMPCPYDPIDMIVDVEGEVVTIWKTILSLFWVVGVNGFEGVGCGLELWDGWKVVWDTNRK